MLDKLTVCGPAVNLDGAETPIRHTARTTHCGAPKDLREGIGLADARICISVGNKKADDFVLEVEPVPG